MNFKTRN